MATMNMGVAATTQGYQVLFAVLASMAAETDVVDFKPAPCAADLALPSVTLEDSPVQLAVRISVQP